MTKMSKTPWFVLGALALAGAATAGVALTTTRRRESTTKEAFKASDRCERLLAGLEARIANFR